MTGASMAEFRQPRRRARLLGSQKATQIVREGEPPSQAVPDIQYLLREALRVLVYRWPMGGSDHRQHTLGRSGREVVNRSPASYERRYDQASAVVETDQAMEIAARLPQFPQRLLRLVPHNM